MNEKRRKLFASLAHAKYRKAHRLFLVEGAHGVEALLKSSWKTETILTSDPDRHPQISSDSMDIPVERISRKDMERIATTSTPQDIVAVARLPENDPGIISRSARILIADGLKDPSNLGTIIRSAAAFGFETVVTTAGTVDIFSPKVVRATQGALFAIDTAQRIDGTLLSREIASGHTVYALVTEGDTPIQSVRPEGRIALIVGGEIDGVSRPMLRVAEQRIRIPISRNVDSLNAAVAAGIAMFFFDTG
jgi:TrmH family RNA methyltransferase